MNKRWIFILLGVIAFFLTLGVGAVAGGALTYLYLQTRPVQAPAGVITRLNQDIGALIVAVEPGSPAEQAGLQARDVILSVDGQELGLDHDLAEVIRSYRPGDSTILEVKRPGEEQTHEISVTLGENPNHEGQAYLGVSYAPFYGLLGPEGGDRLFRFPFVPDRERFRDSLPFDLPPLEQFPIEPVFPDLPEGIRQGVIVGQVSSGSPAEQASLKAGDLVVAVDGQPLENPQDLVETIHNREPGDEVTLTVYRRGENQAREIEVRLAENPEQAGQAYLGVTIRGFLRIESGENHPPDTFFPWPHPELPHQGGGEVRWFTRSAGAL